MKEPREPMVNATFRLPVPQVEAIKAICKAEGRCGAELVREAIAAWLRRKSR